MTKKTAPYKHTDGSNCWTKNCRLGNQNAFGDKLVEHVHNGKLNVDIANLPYRPIIGLDLDGTTLKYNDGFKEYLMKRLNLTNEHFPEPTSYSFPDSGWPMKDMDEFKKLHAEAVDEGLYENLIAIDGAVEALQRLVRDGYRIRIITSRFIRPGQHAEVVRQTTENLDKTGVPYRDISFTADKADIRADVYLDDAPYNIIALREAKKKVIVYGQKYNEGFDGRVIDWVEAEAEIRRLAPIDPPTE